MSSESRTELMPAAGRSWEIDPVDEPTVKPEHPAKRLHRLFRKRYHWVVLLVLLGGVGGGYYGYQSAFQNFRSEGTIEVKPVLPKILYSNEQNSAIPMFDGFVQRLVALMQSPRVIDLAMAQDKWKRFGYGGGPEAREQFRQSLSVRTAAGNQLIYVYFVDEDPQTAKAAVESTIATFLKIYQERDIYNVDNKLQVLEKRRVDLTNELRSIRSRILAIANEFGSDALASQYEYKLEEMQKLESTRESIKLQLVSAEAMAAQNPDSVDEPVTDFADTELLMSDRLGSQYLQRKQALEREMEQLSRRYGSEHRLVKNVEADIAMVQRDIDARLDEIRAAIEANGGIIESSTGLAGMTNAQRIEALRQQLKRLDTLYQSKFEDTLALGRKNLQIDNLKAEMATIESRLQETNNRIESLKVESLGVGGRLEVQNDGILPTQPYQDTYRKKTVMFGVGGAAGGFFIMLLIALIDSRLRSADDMATTLPNVNMLGILPDLPANMNDPEAAVKASRAVHQIRTLLQLTSRGDADVGSAACITSPTPGSGKTSLAHALGISFALAGTRTLLIDMDLAGGGLTRRSGAAVRRRLGDVLRRSGRLTEQQVEQALDEAIQSNQRLGESLVRLGYISEDELKYALQTQTMAIVGTIDALNGEPLERCVARGAAPGLDILPLGNAGAHDVSRISPKAVGAMIERAKQQYDAVLIDTGPMPACLEASMAASRCDTTILVVPRNANRSMTQMALNQLGKVNAKVAGLVFNRANEADFRGSIASTMSVSGELSAPIDTTPLKTDIPDHYDPLARAVYSYASTPDEQTDNGSNNGSNGMNGRSHVRRIAAEPSSRQNS